jgi:hypothetical protein
MDNEIPLEFYLALIYHSEENPHRMSLMGKHLNKDACDTEPAIL